MTAKVLLMFDDLIKSDFVLDEKCDFDVELVNVLFGELVLSDLMNYGLS